MIKLLLNKKTKIKLKLDCVLTAVNENKLYLDFVPIFIKTWNKLYPNVDVKIILISEKIPNEFIKYKNHIILFKPIKNVITSFTAQIIRIYYPSILKYNNGVLITDIDILPMNNKYYTKNIKNYDNNKFVYFRDHILLDKNQIIICYNVALPSTWQDIFKIYTTEDIRITIKNIYNKKKIIEGHGNKGWNTDQKELYTNVMKWNNHTKNLICIDETKSLISSDVIKILDPTSYNNSLTRFRDDMYLLYIQGISEGKSPLQLLDYKDKNFIGKDFLQYQTDKNKIFKNMMDNVEKKEVDESKKKLPGESPSEYLKRISE